MNAKMLKLLAVLACVAFIRPVDAQSLGTVRLASAQNSLGSLAVVIAEQQGFFKQAGVGIQVIDFTGGAPAVQALASGSVEICICAADHAVRLRSRGLPGLVLVALTEHHGYGLVALASSPYTDLASLKGKPVGITSPGSLTDNTLRYYISELKLDPDSDFQLVGTGTGGTMRAAIQSGAVAAGMLTTPDVQAALGADGKFKLVMDFRELQYPALDLLAMQGWVTAHPDAARAFAGAVVKAEHAIQTDPAAVDAGLLEMFPKLDPKLRGVLAQEAPKLLSKDGVMAPAGYDMMLKMMQVSDPTVTKVPYATVTDLAILPKP